MSHLTVYFDDPWWIGVIEFETDGIYCAVRHLFGSNEPTGAEVYLFVLRELASYLANPPLGLDAEPNETSAIKRVSPKRAARLAARNAAPTEKPERLMLWLLPLSPTLYRLSSIVRLQVDYRSAIGIYTILPWVRMSVAKR
jgi:hypothetical protein